MAQIGLTVLEDADAAHALKLIEFLLLNGERPLCSMSKLDTIKTAKISILAEDQASDGHQDRHVRKARRKERQRAKKIIKEELKQYGKP